MDAGSCCNPSSIGCIYVGIVTVLVTGGDGCLFTCFYGDFDDSSFASTGIHCRLPMSFGDGRIIAWRKIRRILMITTLLLGVAWIAFVMSCFVMSSRGDDNGAL